MSPEKMPENGEIKSPEFAPPQFMVQQTMVNRAIFPLMIALLAFLGLLFLILFPYATGRPTEAITKEPFLMLMVYTSHIFLFFVTIVTSILGYKLIAVSGIQTNVVIPHRIIRS